MENTFSVISRPSLRLEAGSSQTSQTSSTSTSRAWSPPRTFPPAPSPTAHRSSTSSRASTPCSTSWTTPSWACECCGVDIMCADVSKRHWTLALMSLRRRTGVNLAIRDNNGTFLSTLSMHLYQVRPETEQNQNISSSLLTKSLVNKMTISHMCMFLFFFLFPMQQDEQYQQALIMPPTGLNLKTKIYVAVKASNLTER